MGGSGMHTLTILAILVLAAIQGTGGEFVFATSKRGYEKLLKLEIQQAYGDKLKFAFSRPGLLTFKTDDAATVDSFYRRQHAHSLTFLRSSGKSIPTQVASTAEIIEQVKGLSQSRPLCLHVFGREEEEGLRSEHPQVGIDRKARINACRNELLSLAPELFAASSSSPDHKAGAKAAVNDIVLDVCVGEAGEKIFLGQHMHLEGPGTVGSTGYANNLLPFLEMPSEAPSRAYMKMENAITYFGLPVLPQEQALEIGSAPGGCVYSLLQRGLRVCGVDPCPADRTHSPVVKKSKDFIEVRSFLRNLRIEQVPARAEWILCDANAPPEELLPYLLNMCAHYQQSLKGMLYTVKINDKLYDGLKPDRLLAYLQETRDCVVGASGGALFSEVSMLTLPANRQEVLIMAKTKLCK